MPTFDNNPFVTRDLTGQDIWGQSRQSSYDYASYRSVEQPSEAIWTTSTGRQIPLSNLSDLHLQNIYNKMQRDRWRLGALPYIVREMNRRGILTEHVESKKKEPPKVEEIQKENISPFLEALTYIDNLIDDGLCELEEENIDDTFNLAFIKREIEKIRKIAEQQCKENKESS